MAVVKFGSGISSISGKIAGTVFKKSSLSGSGIMQKHPRKKREPSIRQSQHLSYFQESYNRWRSLSAAKQAAFSQFFGGAEPGRLGYMQQEARRLEANYTGVTQKPQPGEMINPVFEFSASPMKVTVSVDSAPGNTRTTLYCSRPFPPGIRYAFPPLRYISRGALSVFITGTYPSVFGRAPRSGESVFFYAVCWRENWGITMAKAHAWVEF